MPNPFEAAIMGGSPLNGPQQVGSQPMGSAPPMGSSGMGPPPAGPPPMGGGFNDAQMPTGAQRAGSVEPTITIPDTISASMANLNKHLILVQRGQEQVDWESVTPQMETLQTLLQSLEESEGNSDG